MLVTSQNIDIGILDFGQTKRLSRRDRLAFARLIDAIARRNAHGVQVAMSLLGIEVVPRVASSASGERLTTYTINRTARRKGKAIKPIVLAESSAVLSYARSLTATEKLAYTMFDTADVPGVSNNPFASDSALRSATIEKFPQELFFLLRTVQILKGICSATYNADFSVANAWAPIARRALRSASSQ